MGWPKGVPRKPQGAAEAPSPQSQEITMSDKVLVRIIRDFWGEPHADGSENRSVAGTIVEVSVEEAMTGLENGTVERVKAEEPV
jgi:hypothetical protein